MIYFLEDSGIKVSFTQQEIVDIGLGIADGTLEYEDVSAKIIQKCK